ncbi:hypothetical protein C7974DRAFT_148983 [Boeremia exigua]|uniref:uncharacterized protein n=1 Tax=Boeremia exigua TaxID=749465 RepID=UPI001E8DAB58|nr:uncharacterized protein C7974DRAFT_148983 [Boeremia exigua]KAH6637814.1 hypothetical protein C7974DRAFT_148983 [Boeremia exigua]
MEKNRRPLGSAGFEFTTPRTSSTTSSAFVGPVPKDSRISTFDLKDYSKPVTVFVGKAQQKFVVHQSLLTGRSPFFDKALNGRWAEADERAVKLHEDEPTVFAVYVHLLYTDKIAVSPTLFGTTTGDVDGERKILAKLYILAEKVQDVETKNKTMAALMGTLRDQVGGKRVSLSLRFVQTIYNGTPNGSMARKLIVDSFVEQGTGTPFRLGGRMEDAVWPVEFMQELLAEVLDRRATLKDTFTTGDREVSSYMEQKGNLKL